MGAIIITTNIIVQEGEIEPVNASIDFINDVFKHDGEGKVSLTEDRRIPGDVLANFPEDTLWGGLGGASTEDLGAVKPHSGNAIILGPTGRDGKVEDDVGPSTVPRRGVVCGGRRQADGVIEDVGEDWEYA